MRANMFDFNGLDCPDGKLKATSKNWKAADVAQQANVAVFLAPLAAAEIQYSKPADGKVVTDRIGGIELRKAIGDRARGLPIGRFAIVQPEKRSDAMHVRVERHHELRRIDEIPDAEVRRGAADHPAQEEVHALARA